jgi:hypothetical protein
MRNVAVYAGMQANKIWKSVLFLLIPVLIGLSWFACNMAEDTALRTGGPINYQDAFSLVFLGGAVVGFFGFLWSLPVILMIAMIYRLFKGLD